MRQASVVEMWAPRQKIIVFPSGEQKVIGDDDDEGKEGRSCHETTAPAEQPSPSPPVSTITLAAATTPSTATPVAVAPVRQTRDDDEIDWIPINCALGCEHRCRYCYARTLAGRDAELGTMINIEEWWARSTPIPSAIVNRKIRTLRTRHPTCGAWFPSAHDITPSNIDTCIAVCEQILESGAPTLLVTTKPHPACMHSLCHALRAWRDRVRFRFTITAMDNALLKHWEPGAPCWEERLEALVHVHAQGFSTAVAITPALDPANIPDLCAAVRPYVTRYIKIGAMRHAEIHVTQSLRALCTSALRSEWMDDKLYVLYTKLQRFGDIIRYDRALGVRLASLGAYDV